MARLTGLALAFNSSQTAVTPEGRPPVLLAPDAAGTAAAEVLVLVGDQGGRLLGELRCDLAGVAWKLNNYGQARLTMARADGTARPELLQFGNRMLIQFGNGLPDWGGVIDTPRQWSNGKIAVVAYSGEYLLTWRITGRGRYFNQVTAGEIFRALLREAKPVGVDAGTVWMGGTLHSPDYHLRGLFDIYSKSLTDRLEAADWSVSAGLADGVIRLRANFHERRGSDHGNRLALVDGVNAVVGKMDEQGPIVNEWQLAGAGTGWGETTRIYAAASDQDSQTMYGLRQRGELRVDISQQSTLDANALLGLGDTRQPRKVVSVQALDRPPARFRDYDVGDTLLLEAPGVGFDGYEAAVRVVAREFLPDTGACALVIE